MTTAIYPARVSTRVTPRAAPRAVFQLFCVLFAGTSLAAYNVGPVPLPWLAAAGFIALGAALVLGTNRVRLIPGGGAFFLFLAWTVFVQTLNAGRFGALLPSGASLPYVPFVLVRYMNLFAFAATLYLTYWLLTEGKGADLIRWIVRIGFVIALVSIYIYIAQQFGLPEPARTRAGTAGAAQVLFFGYRRALGTFREPSHLAEWLLLPLFLSFAVRGPRARLHSATIGAALLLTVSLGGIASCVGGVMGGLVLSNPLKPRNLRLLVLITLGFALLLFVAQITSVGISGQSVYSILNVRTLEILEGGVGSSDRAYIAEFVHSFPPPLLGYGLGNANIFVASKLGIDLVVSFLSLYVNVAYSSGIIGLLLLSFFMIQPIVRNAISDGGRKIRRPVPILMCYVAYLLVFAAGPEELSIAFAIIAAFLLYDGSIEEGVTAPPRVSLVQLSAPE
jgi:hypothetical protein